MLRLMIVDDEQIIREALSEIIDYEALGYSLIASAKNGMEAYEMICDEYPDVVITDIRMPILNGLELIERVTKGDSKITFILLSGYNDFAYAKQAMKFGVRHYLLKPTDPTELMETLEAVRMEHFLAEQEKINLQKCFLQEFKTPLEQSFALEALEDLEHFSHIYEKYQPFLALPSEGIAALICSFVEESYLPDFTVSIFRRLEKEQIPAPFSLIYVKNNAVIFLSPLSLSQEEALADYLSELHFPDQSVNFAPCFLHSPDTAALFLRIFTKISRFERILLLDAHGTAWQLFHNVASPSQINRIYQALSHTENPFEFEKLLQSAFSPDLPLETARAMALGLFLKWNTGTDSLFSETVSDFFQKLYSCPDLSSIQELLPIVLSPNAEDNSQKKHSPHISLAKNYVKQHYADENLSLKWLAENYLFISVGYLSKQFVKEENIRFSDYLNRIRMEEAKKLMRFYRNDNIQQIAVQVGFGNNPQYFRQVFKRYTGITPSEYLKYLKSLES